MLFALPLRINIISVALAARINNVAVFTEMVGTVVVALILIILFATKPIHPVSFLFDTGGVTGGDIITQLPLAALMGSSPSSASSWWRTSPKRRSMRG